MLKTLSILDLKKIGDQWIVKSVDFRDETTRNKTRFAVTAAALNQNFPSALLTRRIWLKPAGTPGDLVILTK